MWLRYLQFVKWLQKSVIVHNTDRGAVTRSSQKHSIVTFGMLECNDNYIELIKPYMKIGFVDADLLDNGTRHPNLALMKISGYCKSVNCETVLLDTYEDIPKYDLVFVSCVFTFTKTPNNLLDHENVYIGGTGFNPQDSLSLPDVIEHSMPYYDIYKSYVLKRIEEGKPRSRYADYLDYSIGFVTRGCFRGCTFCVNRKYSRAVAHSHVSEFVDEKRPYIYLWDDNFFAYSGWEQILNDLIATQKPFQFRQGLDIRLLTKHKAERISKAKYIGDYIFAFDHIEDREIIESKLALWRSNTSKGTRLYVLCAFDSQDEIDIANTFERILILMHFGCLPYIMRYESYKNSPWEGMYVQLARWCNQPQFFKKKSFRDFCETNDLYHKNPATHSSAYNVMVSFEESFPNIAEKYFDLRYEDINVYGEYLSFKRNDNLFCEQCSFFSEKLEKLFIDDKLKNKVLLAYFMKDFDFECFRNNAGRCKAGKSREVLDSFIGLLERTSIDSIVSLLSESKNLGVINSHNIPQFDNINDVFLSIPALLNDAKEFLTYQQVGITLHERVINEGCFAKIHGELNAKCSALLDLAIIKKMEGSGHVGQSVFGAAYSHLSTSRKQEILPKLMLRIPIIRTILVEAVSGQIHVTDYMNMLSDSVAESRKVCVLEMLRLIERTSPESSLVKGLFKNIKE